MDNIVIEPEIKIEYIDTDTKDPLSLRKNDSIVSTECLSDDSLQSTNKECASWFKCINNAGKYCCRFCELSYSTLQTLRIHTKRKHSTEAIALKTAISNNKRRKKIKCHNCKIKFTSLKDLELHYNNTHKTVKENYCHICRSVFGNQNMLSDHLLSKHNIALSKMHVCDTCGYVTTKFSHYKQHRNTHYSQNVENCKFCDYTTSYLPNLNIHLQIHNTDKPYSCDFNGCLYKTKSCASLKSHKLKHNKEINFKYCDKCTFKTVYVQTLRKHLDSHERLIDHNILPRISLTSSRTGVTSPAGFIDCEMSLRTSVMSSAVEMMGGVKKFSSDFQVGPPLSPWTSVMSSPTVQRMESQSRSSSVSSKSTDHYYNVPQTKRKGLTTVLPISQPASGLPPL